MVPGKAEPFYVERLTIAKERLELVVK